MATNIFVMAHKKVNISLNEEYIPIHVGRDGKEDLGYIGDNTGDNISDLNSFYGELTGMYWLWKNYSGDGNIGICHYRRFFINDRGYMLREKDYDEILEEHDIITSPAIEEELPYIDYWASAHNKNDLMLERKVIEKIYPEYLQAFDECMNNKSHYFGNLMVTHYDLYNEYCEWLFNIFAELGEYLDLSGYDEYHRRIYGFLSEQLLMVWIKTRGLKVYENKVGIFEEKAETRELKTAVSVLLRDKKYADAYELFFSILKARPDIMLEHSDLSGEIPIIAKILTILSKKSDGIGDKVDIHGQKLDKLSSDMGMMIEYIRNNI